MSYWRDWPGLLNFTGEPAGEAVRRLIGDRPFRHVLGVPPLGTRQRQEVMDYAAERGVELLEERFEERRHDTTMSRHVTERPRPNWNHGGPTNRPEKHERPC